MVLLIVATSCHVGIESAHLWSQHYSNIFFPAEALPLEEGWCVDMTSQWPVPAAPPEPNGLIVSARIAGSLTGNSGEDWDDAFGARTNFTLVGGCDSFNENTTPKRSEIHVEYHATTDTRGSFCNAADAGVSCVFHFESFEWADGHIDRLKSYVMLDVDTIGEDGYRHTISHETGHVLGLGDPTPGPDTNDGGRVFLGLEKPDKCRMQGAPGVVLWIDSIMHAPPSYCGAYGENRDWPTAGDRKTVGDISGGRGQ